MDSTDHHELTSIYNLNFPNVFSSPIERFDVDFGNYMACTIVVPYLNRLYACSNYPDKECISWDLNSGENNTHPPLNTQYSHHCSFSLVGLNGKIWINGGYVNDYDKKIKSTYFLQPNFTWIKGPDLPEAKAYHTSVSIDDFRAVIFGNTEGIWIYNDKLKSFERKRSFDIGENLSAYKINDFTEIGNEVILVRGNLGLMFVYNWFNDTWYELDSSWTVPSSFYYNSALFQTDKRCIVFLHVTSSFQFIFQTTLNWWLI